MQSNSNMAIKHNSDSLETKTFISNSVKKHRNTSTKCKLSLVDQFDHHRLADRLDHHRSIGATNIYYKTKRRKLNNGD